MKTCSITEAKGKLGALADAALAGEPTLLTRGGQCVILQAYPARAPIPRRHRGYFADMYTAEDLALERRLTRKLKPKPEG